FFGIAQCRPVAAGDLRHHLALDQGADVPAALIEPAWRPRRKLGIDVALPQVDRLHHVHLGVDQPKTILGHLGFSRPPSRSISYPHSSSRRRPGPTARSTRPAAGAMLKKYLTFRQ